MTLLLTSLVRHFYFLLLYAAHYKQELKKASVFSYISFSAHKRIRKPSKRLIEWTEEYDQIFCTRKKNKKPLHLIGKVKIIQSKICCNFIIICCYIYTVALSIQYHFLQLRMKLVSLIDNEITSCVFSALSAHYLHARTRGIGQGRT